MGWYYNKSDWIFLLFSFLFFIVAVGFICWERHQMRSMVTRMNQMLEAATAGKFSERLFDESIL